MLCEYMEYVCARTRACVHACARVCSTDRMLNIFKILKNALSSRVPAVVLKPILTFGSYLDDSFPLIEIFKSFFIFLLTIRSQKKFSFVNVFL